MCINAVPINYLNNNTSADHNLIVTLYLGKYREETCTHEGLVKFAMVCLICQPTPGLRGSIL